MRFALLCSISIALFGCASEPPKRTEPPLEVSGVRQTPLTEQEITEKIRDRADALRFCYGNERRNLGLQGNLSDYLLRVRVPNDGTPSTVEVEKETVPGQSALAGCVTDALKTIAYPKHVGAPITLQVPIKGPN